MTPGEGFGGARDWPAQAPGGGPVATVNVGGETVGSERRLTTIENKLDQVIDTYREEKAASAKRQERTDRWIQWGFGILAPVVVALAIAGGRISARLDSIDENGTAKGKSMQAGYDRRILDLELAEAKRGAK